MKPPSLISVLAPSCVLAAAMSTATSAQPQSPPELKAGGNSLEIVTSDGVVQTYGGGPKTIAEIQARYADPQQRAKMRQEQRQSIAETHYGVADALQLDAATFEKLIDLLTDQRMEQSENFFNEFPARSRAADRSKPMHAEAERATKRVEALRAVLGQEKLERYQTLEASLARRSQVRELDERLGEADKLNRTQRERLVELLQEQITASIDRMHALNFRRSPWIGDLFNLSSREELHRQSQLHTIASNEESWREMPESNRQLREQAAGVLTERQLAMLEQIQTEQLATHQQQIEQMRVQAGLSPAIPEQPQVIEEPPATVDREVKLSLKVSVDSESPRHLTTVVSSGKSVSLKISEALFLEATPVVFEDDAYNLRVEYFENGVTGKRSIGNMGESGKLKPAGPASVYTSTGGGSTVITGSKGYAVELSAVVEAT